LGYGNERTEANKIFSVVKIKNGGTNVVEKRTGSEISPEVAAAIGEAVARSLGDILPQIIAAVKEPGPIEQRQFDEMAKEIEERQKERLNMSKQVLEDMANKKAQQATCSHEHRRGDGHGVHIQDRLPHGYVLCQVCQIRVRPELDAEYRKLDPRAVYDTALYNKIFQKIQSLEAFQ
jgi:hypothetical protein